MRLDSLGFWRSPNTNCAIYLSVYLIYIYIYLVLSGWDLSYVVAGVSQRLRQEELCCGIVPHLEHNINNAETWG